MHREKCLGSQSVARAYFFAEEVSFQQTDLIKTAETGVVYTAYQMSSIMQTPHE